MKIALLGAPGTGKTTLARELAAHFKALGRKRSDGDITLVMGLDLPYAADLQHQVAIDTQLRAMLHQARIPYRVVYGAGADRLRNALAAIDASLAPAPARRDWVRQCDKCSDPDCEHRLFARLVDRQ